MEFYIAAIKATVEALRGIQNLLSETDLNQLDEALADPSKKGWGRYWDDSRRDASGRPNVSTFGKEHIPLSPYWFIAETKNPTDKATLMRWFGI